MIKEVFPRCAQSPLEWRRRAFALELYPRNKLSSEGRSNGVALSNDWGALSLLMVTVQQRVLSNVMGSSGRPTEHNAAGFYTVFEVQYASMNEWRDVHRE